MTALSYGSVIAEYNAIQSGAALFDRSDRGRIRLSGARASEMVSGLVTNDVSALAPGHGCYAAALTAKGKIVADVRVFVEETGVLVDTPSRCAAAWAAMVKKFVNPRIAPHVEESAGLRTLGIYGPNAHHVAASLTGIQATALSALAFYSHVTAQIGNDVVIASKSPDLGIEGFDLFVPAPGFDAMWDRARAAGGQPAGLTAWDAARVEAGRPEWGVDMDENTIPQEANFDELNAISYTKGCYVGQETVARLHFRGHVNKYLRGVRVTSGDTPAYGATLHDTSGLQVGDVRSISQSPRLGNIGIAMIRREVETGAMLIARSAADADTGLRESRVEVKSLPFERV